MTRAVNGVRASVVPLLKRVDAQLPWALVYRGDAVECPCCQGRFRKFRPFHGRKSAKCPRCGSLERHRTLWLFLRDRLGLQSGGLSVLHLAPEQAIERRLRELPNVRYTAADLHPGRPGILRADITALPFDDEQFDVVVCNHVLEHVPDDGGAMRELYRVLAANGRAVMQHPIDEQRATTFEDAAVTSPADRRRVFGQADHVRIYGRDFRDRLAGAGFSVSLERYAESLPEDLSARYRLAEHGARFSGSDIHVAAKPG